MNLGWIRSASFDRVFPDFAYIEFRAISCQSGSENRVQIDNFLASQQHTRASGITLDSLVKFD